MFDFLKLLFRTHSCSSGYSVPSAETYALGLEVLLKHRRTIDEEEELSLLVSEMLERNFIRSVSQIDSVISACWKSRNMNGLAVIFDAMTEHLKPHGPNLKSLREVLPILDSAIESGNPHCCAAIYAYCMNQDVDIPEDTLKTLSRMWDRYVDLHPDEDSPR